MNCYEKIVDSTQGLVGYIQTDNKDISWRNYQSYDKIYEQKYNVAVGPDLRKKCRNRRLIYSSIDQA